MPHDIFISHSTHDGEIANLICADFEQNGMTCWIAPRDIAGGEAWDEAIMNGLEQCRLVVLILSEVSNESIHVKREIMRAMDKQKHLLPVRIANIQPGRQLEYLMTGIQWFDAFRSPTDQHLPGLRQLAQRILAMPDPEPKPVASVAPRAVPLVNAVADSLASPARVSGAMPAAVPAPAVVAAATATDAPAVAKPQVALLYKRNTQPDGYVLSMLERGFREAGYDVFVDRHMQIGVEWVHELERNIRISVAVIPILSQASAQSEMLNYEVETALRSAQSQHGQPRLLPVRVGYEGSLGETLDTALKQLQYALWKDQNDDQLVMSQLLQSLRAKDEVSAEAVKGYQRDRGALPPNSKFYVSRPSDDALAEALVLRDTIVLIKGGRQMGKTSLMVRGLKQARELGATVIYTDLQKLNASDLLNIKQFYFAMAHMLADQMDLEVDIEDTWKERHAPSVNFERYLKKEIMPHVPGHLYWALDEVDRLFTTEFGSEVFGLFRSWHNERASNPDTPWTRLTMIIAYATEAHLFIADPNQSPFNVGTRLELRDFDIRQEEEMNKLFGRPLFTDDQLNQFYGLVSGQPYLVGRGLYELATTKIPFDQFAAVADLDEGPFGDHLRRILVMLVRDASMVTAVKTVLAGTNTLTLESFYRLRAAGLVVGEGPAHASMRCQLYANYLKGHLEKPA